MSSGVESGVVVEKKKCSSGLFFVSFWGVREGEILTVFDSSNGKNGRSSQ